MFQKFLCFMVLCIVSMSAWGQSTVTPDSPLCYQPFMFGVIPYLPESQAVANVRGVKVGAPTCYGYGYVMGIETSVLGSMTSQIYGSQSSIVFCYNDSFYGSQAAIVGCVNQEAFTGAQTAIVFNVSGDVLGVQVACGPNVSKYVTGAQISALLSIAKGDVCGLQISSLFNYACSNTGFQAGVVNITGKSKAFSLGVINFVEEGGIQFGLLNWNAKGFLPVFPLINFEL